jgi:NADH-quinone oxidoreductase subunit M
MNTILPLLLIAIPLLTGAALVLSAKQLSEATGKSLALWLAAVVCGLSIWQWFAVSDLLSQPTTSSASVQAAGALVPVPFTISAPGGIRVQIALGADSLGAAMVLLTAIIGWTSLTVATQHVTKNFTSYAGWIMLAQAGLMIVFLAMDILLFYIGFELAILPLLVLIAGWGEEDSPRVAKRFVLFTLAGSIPLVLALVGIIWLYSTPGSITTLFSELSLRAAAGTATLEQQQWIFGLLIFGLGIKMALIPLHTWLPDTYRAATPTTSALLAAVVLKMGLFGFLRLAIPMLPAATDHYGVVVLGSLGVLAIVYGGLSALAQRDLRLLLAYSSLSHVGFITLGLFSLTREGVAGAALQMFNHGITTAAMFLLAGCLIQRSGTAMIQGLGPGLASVYPRLAILTIFFLMAGAGMPGANNFVGELLALSGMLSVSPFLAGVAILGILLGAWYSLRLAKDVLFGTASSKSTPRQKPNLFDLSLAEWLPLSVLVAITLLIGLWPQVAIESIQMDTNRLVQVYETLPA